MGGGGGGAAPKNFFFLLEISTNSKSDLGFGEYCTLSTRAASASSSAKSNISLHEVQQCV